MTILGNIKSLISRNPSPPNENSDVAKQDAINTKEQENEPFASEHAEILPRYNLMEVIGEGAFSKVHKAYDNELQKHIAIKVIDKSSMSLQQINSVLKEISIMSKVHHKNVVSLYSYKNSIRYCYLMMELVEGGEIFDQIIKYTYLSEDLSRHIIVQVANALKYLHEDIGVVHRDIKPENLLFVSVPFVERSQKEQLKARRKSDDNDKRDEGVFIEGVGSGTIGVVKIADFGLSKILWDNHTKTPVGTQGYTAPEILKDESYSKAVDCFSLGCVLYTLLCGFPPFYDSDPKVLAEKVSKGDYCFLSPWWNEISQGAKDLVSNLLTVDASKRYTIDDLLNDPWILQNPNKKASKAIDYPRATMNRTLYEQFQNDTAESLLSPRAEAIRFAFDTSNALQLQQQSKPALHGTMISEEEEDFLSDIDTDDSSLSSIEDDLDDDTMDDKDIPILTKKNSVINQFKPIINKPTICIKESSIQFNNNDTSCDYKHHVSHTKLPKTPVPADAKPRMCKTDYKFDTEEDYIQNTINNFDLKLNASTMLHRRKLAGSAKCGSLT